MKHYPPDDEAHPDGPDDQWGQGGADSGGQAGDTQGLSQATNASEETVEELAEAGQDYEAGIQEGIEDAADHPETPVPSHAGQEREDVAPRREPMWHRHASPSPRADVTGLN
jgi:hypothetical protein